MKKILFIVFCLLIAAGCNKKIEENDTDLNYTLSLIKTENCNHGLKEYYTYENRTIYLVCLNEIYLKRENGKDMTLKYHLENVNQSFDRSIEQLVNDMENTETLKDGGTKIYKKDDYTIISCNTIDNNKDIYIGDETLEYHQGFCKQ